MICKEVVYDGKNKEEKEERIPISQQETVSHQVIPSGFMDPFAIFNTVSRDFFFDENKSSFFSESPFEKTGERGNFPFGGVFSNDPFFTNNKSNFNQPNPQNKDYSSNKRYNFTKSEQKDCNIKDI